MPSRDLALALALADTADQITLSRAGAADLRIDRKPDRTPVTDADLAVEAAIRTVLRHDPARAVLQRCPVDPWAPAWTSWGSEWIILMLTSPAGTRSAETLARAASDG